MKKMDPVNLILMILGLVASLFGGIVGIIRSDRVYEEKAKEAVDKKFAEKEEEKRREKHLRD